MVLRVTRILLLATACLLLLGNDGGCPVEDEAFLPGAGSGGGSDDDDDNGDLDLTYRAADWVIGQSGPEERNLDRPPDADVLTEPAVSAFRNDLLFTADRGNNRVTGHVGLPEQDNLPADFVLGQPGMTDAAPGFGPDGMDQPDYLATDGQGLAVSDPANDRVLIWRELPDSGPTDAETVVGAPDLDSAPAPGCFADSVNRPWGVTAARNRLLVADHNQDRILVWDEWPEPGSSAQERFADAVIGQEDLETCVDREVEAPAGDTLFGPAGLWSDGSRLAVADHLNNRVLLWDQFPEDGEAADTVLGQPDMESADFNEGGLERGMDQPVDVHWDGERLLVVDPNNHRVLVWTSWPGENHARPDAVLGQPDLESAIANNTGDERELSARSLNRPTGVFSDGDRIFVTDRDNDRVVLHELSGTEGDGPGS